MIHRARAALKQRGADLDQFRTDKFAAVDLIPRREFTDARLGPFIDKYLATRTDLKPRTRTNFGQCRRQLVDYFGEHKPLRDVTPGESDEWRRWMLTRPKKKLSENTARRHCGRAKQLFRVALRKRLIAENPFGDMKALSAIENKSREFFVSRDMAEKVLAACPSLEWRLIFALARFGGLRTPSETALLRWGDIDWEHGRMTVTSPKTEHHEGKESRVVPLFPEIRPLLEAAFDQAEPGTEFVIHRRRDETVNWRTQLERIIHKAGLTPWPKPFQNLRSTRETELAETFPAHVVCKWLGNSEAVARKHYLQVTDDHFARAAESTKPEAVQNPVQCSTVTLSKDPDSFPTTAKFPRETAGYDTVRVIKYPREDSNLQPSASEADVKPSFPRKNKGSANVVAQMVATDTPENGCERVRTADETDPDLARLVSAWPLLSAVVKRMILAGLDAAQTQGEHDAVC